VRSCRARPDSRTPLSQRLRLHLQTAHGQYVVSTFGFAGLVRPLGLLSQAQTWSAWPFVSSSNRNVWLKSVGGVWQASTGQKYSPPMSLRVPSLWGS